MGYDDEYFDGQGVTADTTDDEIETLAQRLDRSLYKQYGTTAEGAADFFRQRRDALRAQERKRVVEELKEIAATLARRDQAILRAHALGLSDRAIGRAVGLSGVGIGKLRARHARAA